MKRKRAIPHRENNRAAPLERLAIDGAARRRRDRRARRRAPLAFEQRELSEVVAAPQRLVHGGANAVDQLGARDRAVLDDVEAVAGGALLEDHLALGEARRPQRVGEHAALVVGERAEDRHVAQEREVQPGAVAARVDDDLLERRAVERPALGRALGRDGRRARRVVEERELRARPARARARGPSLSDARPRASLRARARAPRRRRCGPRGTGRP